MITKSTIRTAQTTFIWYDIVSTSAAEREILLTKHGFTPKMLDYVNDQHEHPRYDLREDAAMLVYSTPEILDKKQARYITSPITFVLKDDTFFTFHSPGTQYIIELVKNDEHLEKLDGMAEFMLLTLYYATTSFTETILKINDVKNQLDTSLNVAITNDKLRFLAEIEKSLIYITSATQTNLLMLENLKYMTIGQKLNHSNRILLKDILFDARQAQRMAQISSDVTARISATSNTILNNTLNNTMKFLTVWSLVLTIPTIITGFYGMNVLLPAANNDWAWALIILLNLLFIGGLIAFLKKHHLL